MLWPSEPGTAKLSNREAAGKVCNDLKIPMSLRGTGLQTIFAKYWFSSQSREHKYVVLGG